LRWQGAAATPLSLAPRLPASQPIIARRQSPLFPPANGAPLKAPEGGRIPKRSKTSDPKQFICILLQLHTHLFNVFYLVNMQKP